MAGWAAIVIDACDETNKLPWEHIKVQGRGNETVLSFI